MLHFLRHDLQGEVHFAGQYHFLDIDENMFYLDRENEVVLGGDDIALDHDLGKREHTWQGPAKPDGPRGVVHMDSVALDDTLL